jgi:hypothetical protein
MPLIIKPSSGSGSATLISVTGTTTNDTLTLPAVTGSVAVVSGTTGGITATNLLSSSTSITGATTLTSTAFGVLQQCSGTSANYTVTLPAVSGNGGKVIGFQMSTALTKLVTIAGNGAETIDGSNTRVMWAGETALLYCDGTAWTKIGGKTIPMCAGQVNSANQTVGSGTATKVTLGTSAGLASAPAAMNDTANSRITICRAGFYVLEASARIFNISAAGSMETLVYRNNSELGIVSRYCLSGDYPTGILPYSVNAAVNDYFETYVRHYIGSNQTLGNNSMNHLFVTEVPQW